MCGIIGFAGCEQAAPILLDGLRRMEYRGYDSAGVAVRSETHGLQVRKAKGRLQVLSDMIHGGADLEGTLGIGHTRWATHGEPNDVNAHPHVSASGNIALVHNGIIENYMEIKEALLKKGVKFASDTDSEVVAQLLEYYYDEDENHNMLNAVSRVLHRIEGSYSFGIICSDYPNALIAARKDSPLILGYGKGCNFIASDVTAVIKYTRDVAYMDDGEVAVVTPDSIDVFNSELVPVQKQISQVNWDVSAAEKGGYAHFMYDLSRRIAGRLWKYCGKEELPRRRRWPERLSPFQTRAEKGITDGKAELPSCLKPHKIQNHVAFAAFLKMSKRLLSEQEPFSILQQPGN